MPVPSDANGAMSSSPRLEGPDASTVDWDHYQVSLTAEAPRRFTVSTAKPVRRALASPAARLLAVVLDNVSFLLIWAAIASTDATFSLDKGNRILFVWFVVGFLVAFSIGQIILLSWRGQTLGRLALGIRIVRYQDESNPGFGHAVVLRNIVPVLIYCIPLIGQVFALIDIFCIFGDEHRCLHDVFADTKVVEA